MTFLSLASFLIKRLYISRPTAAPEFISVPSIVDIAAQMTATIIIAPKRFGNQSITSVGNRESGLSARALP